MDELGTGVVEPSFEPSFGQRLALGEAEFQREHRMLFAGVGTQEGLLRGARRNGLFLLGSNNKSATPWRWLSKVCQSERSG